MKIAFAGKIASGKTTIASAISKYINAERIGFADKVREIVRDLYGPGNEKNRKLLTGVGMGLRAVDPDTWVRVVLDATKDSLSNWVLDDIRFPNELRGLQNAGWVTVRLVVSKPERHSRIKKKYGVSAQEHMQYAQHVSETSLDDVDNSAFDYVIDCSDTTNIQLYTASQLLMSGTINDIICSLLLYVNGTST